MARCWKGTKPLSELLMPYGITRPQWVNRLKAQCPMIRLWSKGRSGSLGFNWRTSRVTSVMLYLLYMSPDTVAEWVRGAISPTIFYSQFNFDGNFTLLYLIYLPSDCNNFLYMLRQPSCRIRWDGFLSVDQRAKWNCHEIWIGMKLKTKVKWTLDPHCCWYVKMSWHGNTSVITGLCEGNPPVTGGFPSQRASDVELWCFLYWSIPRSCWSKLAICQWF